MAYSCEIVSLGYEFLISIHIRALGDSESPEIVCKMMCVFLEGVYIAFIRFPEGSLISEIIGTSALEVES